MTSLYLAVENTLGLYFDGLYHSDTDLLKQVFHPDARYVCASGDDLLQLDMVSYFPIVDARPSPASRNEPRQDKVISIAFAGNKTAFATVNCAIGDKFFTDFLTLIYHDDRWQIIAKVFHYDLKSA
ncbi:nuclear transport factor 2 family protein [Kiloniella laminariae]|uniref:nuclear transport factor 2 family protein n=1 Tax=Kiloniella laminariae TaxID=454162 RepID=UPI00035C5BE8|nr:nuclear transport factor 2 family protein [Kiloniella laminariae]